MISIVKYYHKSANKNEWNGTERNGTAVTIMNRLDGPTEIVLFDRMNGDRDQSAR